MLCATCVCSQGAEPPATSRAPMQGLLHDLLHMLRLQFHGPLTVPCRLHRSCASAPCEYPKTSVNLAPVIAILPSDRQTPPSPQIDKAPQVCQLAASPGFSTPSCTSMPSCVDLSGPAGTAVAAPPEPLCSACTVPSPGCDGAADITPTPPLGVEVCSMVSKALQIAWLAITKCENAESGSRALRDHSSRIRNNSRVTTYWLKGEAGSCALLRPGAAAASAGGPGAGTPAPSWGVAGCKMNVEPDALMRLRKLACTLANSAQRLSDVCHLHDYVVRRAFHRRARQRRIGNRVGDDRLLLGFSGADQRFSLG